MNRNWMLDWSIVATAAAAGILSWCYLEPSSLRQAALLVFGLTALGYLILAVRRDHRSPVLSSPNGTSRGITELALLSEEGTELAVWDLCGRTAMLIGRDVGENDVDVNLDNTVYAGMIDVEHAVLNYTAGSWYVEDLNSRNGIAVQKAADGKKYRLSADKPCRLEKGDILFVGGLTRLAIR